VISLWLWRGDQLLEGSRAWATALAAASARFGSQPLAQQLAAWFRPVGHAWVPAPQAHWSVAVAFAIGAAPLAGLLAWSLWRLGERIALSPLAPRRG
jgi:hypothetical protein